MHPGLEPRWLNSWIHTPIVLCLVTQSCPTLCHPMGYSPPGSSVHGDFSRQEYWRGCHALLIVAILGLQMPCVQTGLESYHSLLKWGQPAVDLRERCWQGGLIRKASEIHMVAWETSGHKGYPLGAASQPELWEGGREQRQRQGNSEGCSVWRVQSHSQIAWVNAPNSQDLVTTKAAPSCYVIAPPAFGLNKLTWFPTPLGARGALQHGPCEKKKVRLP